MMWRTVKLGELCTKITDGSHNPPKGIESSNYPMLSSKNVFDDEINFEKPRYLSEADYMQENKRTDIQQGDVLLTIVGTIGRCAVVENLTLPFTLQRSVAVIKPKQEAVNSRFLMYTLRGMLNEITREARGVAQKGIYLTSLKQLEISLPPFAEQQRIVAKLDAAFAEIDRAIKLVETKQANAEKLKASLLDVSLTSDDAMWKTVKIGDVCKIVNGSTPSRKEKTFWEDGDISWFTIDDMREQGRDIFTTAQHVTQKAVEEKKVKLVPANSVLLCCTASIGEAAIVRKEMATNQQFNSLTPLTNDLSCEYLYYVATTLKDTLLRVSGSTTISFVSIGKLKEIEIPLPPLAVQQRIVVKLDAAFTEIETVFSTTKLAIDYYTALKSSLLAKELQPPQSEAA